MTEEKNTISDRRWTLDRLERTIRKEWLNKMYDTPEYQSFLQQRTQLQNDCEKEGHVRGKFWDNGLGWTWYYCANCGVSFDKERYGFYDSAMGEDE
jgi:hypothetical protein